LAFDIKQQWQLNKITVIPLVLSAVGIIPSMLNQSLTNINLPPHILSQVQKVVMLNTCSIVRKFLNDEVHLSDEEADKP
jgi:Na+/H+-translocating membrane pyrophosphatase